MNQHIPVVCVDGPSGAGKGTLCRLLQIESGFHLLDSGAMYRLAAVGSLKSGINLDNELAVAEEAKKLNIEFKVDDEHIRVMLNGEDVTSDIRTEQAGMGASQVAAHPQVREALLQCQRDFKKSPGLIADGRDMGTVVFPDAPVKIFLTASAEERAKRRKLQLDESGQSVDYKKILSDIQARDEKDMNRSSAPLKPADDAIVLDSTQLNIKEVFAVVLNEMKRKSI
ncbi:MAG: (d)CMP kinase [Agarilytica sp.]